MQSKHEIDDALRAVKLHDGFWSRLVERNRATTLPHVWRECENEGHMRNLDITAGKCDAEYEGGADRDSNLHKILEGAAYCQAITPDPAWDAKMDAVIAQFAAVQEPDGFLVSYITSQKPDQRYQDMARSHELYCMGHMIEAAVEHFQATGKRSYLEIAIRAADHMDATFGPGKLETTSGHQQVELALVKLYQATGEQRYLDLSRYFVDMRGDPERVDREYSGLHIDEGDRRPGRNRPPQYRQDHEPILQQRYAIGHAVRAGYLYAAMADLTMACDVPEYAEAAAAIWNDIVSCKLYLTGGVGTHQYRDEGFGDPYLLPNDTGYCETCGGIALLLFSHRMGLLTGDARVRGPGRDHPLQQHARLHRPGGRELLLPQSASGRRPATAQPLVQPRVLPDEHRAGRPAVRPVRLRRRRQRDLHRPVRRRHGRCESKRLPRATDPADELSVGRAHHD
jgi:DUF1680 family protein